MRTVVIRPEMLQKEHGGANTSDRDRFDVTAKHKLQLRRVMPSIVTLTVSELKTYCGLCWICRDLIQV